MTLRKIAEEHPDWLDYDVAVYDDMGFYNYVGASGDVSIEDELSEGEDGVKTGRKIVVFSGN